ncbi:MAG: hypothetical protein ACTSVO_00200 [Candidatus Heimdallarchaeaceae archaeon]
MCSIRIIVLEIVGRIKQEENLQVNLEVEQVHRLIAGHPKDMILETEGSQIGEPRKCIL